MQRLVIYGMLLIICKIWDLYTTWLRSPDLAREMNPLTRLLGVLGGMSYIVSPLVVVHCGIRLPVSRFFSLP